MKMYVLAFALVLSSVFLFGQQNSLVPLLEKEKKVPDFTINNIEYYSGGSKINASDCYEKYLILDFWAENCVPCIRAFPEIDKLQKEFADKVQFFLIGNAIGDKIRSRYENVRAENNLSLPVAYDPELTRRFGVGSFPTYIIIDKYGNFISRTNKLDREILEGIFQNRDPKGSERIIKIPYDMNRMLLDSGNGGNDTDFLFRSIITKYNSLVADPQSMQDYISTGWFPGNRVQVSNFPLIYLYHLAYSDTIRMIPDWFQGKDSFPILNQYGKYWDPLWGTFVKVKDTAALLAKYNYSLYVPKEKASAQLLQQVMRGDLNNYFGYDIKIVEKDMPCWELIALPGAKQKLQAHPAIKWPREWVKGEGGWRLQCKSVSSLIHQLWIFNQYEPPFIDKTGFDENFRLDMAVYGIGMPGSVNMNILHSELEKYNLKLVKSTNKIKVLVISDKIPALGTKEMLLKY